MIRKKNIPRSLHEGTGAGRLFTRPGMGGVRAPHPAEHNLIQRPDLLRDIRDYLQLKQMHITPALSENIQAVLVVDDLARRKMPSRRIFSWGTNGAVFGVVGVATATFGLYNPAGSGTRVHITKARFQLRTAATISFGGTPEPDFGLTPFPAGMTLQLSNNRQTGEYSPGNRLPAPMYGSMQHTGMGGVNMLGNGVNLAQVILDVDMWTDPGVSWTVTVDSSLATSGFGYAGFDWEEELIG